jgi:hypothetical protein
VHLEPTFEGAVSLDPGQGVVAAIYDGSGSRQES